MIGYAFGCALTLHRPFVLSDKGDNRNLMSLAYCPISKRSARLEPPDIETVMPMNQTVNSWKPPKIDSHLGSQSVCSSLLRGHQLEVDTTILASTPTVLKVSSTSEANDESMSLQVATPHAPRIKGTVCRPIQLLCLSWIFQSPHVHPTRFVQIKGANKHR